MAVSEATTTRERSAARQLLSTIANQEYLRLMLVAGDTLALALAFAAAFLLRFANPLLPYDNLYSSTFYTWLVFWVIPFWLGVFLLYGLYDLDTLFGGIEEYSRAVHACTLGVIVLIIYSFLDRSTSGSNLSRLWLVFVWLLSSGAIIAERFLLRRVVYWLRRHGHLRRRVLIVGANPEGQAIAEQLHSGATSGLEVIGWVDDQPPAADSHFSLPLLGPVSALAAVVREQRIDEIIIASTAVTRDQLLETYHTFGLADEVEIRLSPGLFEILTTGARIKESGYVPLVSLNKLRITGVDAVLKRALDLGLIMLSLPFLVPLFMFLAVAVKLDSAGPVFHRRRVLGVGRRPFDAYKFRSMGLDADARLAQLLDGDPEARAEFECSRKLKDDPRTTRFGRLLRRTSADELPQLINVLTGQMSLVGPRMIAPDEITLYGKWWMNLLTVKPGITGPWQVMGRNDLPYDERVSLSMRYIRNHSVWLDLQILYQTIGVVVRGRGAY
jgi:exopolysaccharide biosynthesis polyprenyl glycosylphosphotransferase